MTGTTIWKDEKKRNVEEKRQGEKRRGKQTGATGNRTSLVNFVKKEIEMVSSVNDFVVHTNA